MTDIIVAQKKEDATVHFVLAVNLAQKATEERHVGSPKWLFEANYYVGESLRFKDKARALAAYQAYLKQAPPDDVYRRDAEDAIKQLGGRAKSD